MSEQLLSPQQYKSQKSLINQAKANSGQNEWSVVLRTLQSVLVVFNL